MSTFSAITSCCLIVGNKVSYFTWNLNECSLLFCEGEPAWSALNPSNKFLPGTFLLFPSKLTVFCFWVWSLITAPGGKWLFGAGFIYLRRPLWTSKVFYYTAIITLSSFELASWRRSKYRAYQSLKRRSGLSSVRPAAGSGRDVGGGGALKHKQLWPTFHWGDTHSKLRVLNSCFYTDCMMSVILRKLLFQAQSSTLMFLQSLFLKKEEKSCIESLRGSFSPSFYVKFPSSRVIG